MALSSANDMFRIPTTTFIFFSVLFLPFGAAARTDSLGTECLKGSPSEFVGSVRAVIHVLQGVASNLSRFSNGFLGLYLSNAISDCLDLMDLSSDVISWSVSAIESPKGKQNGTGNLGSDLRTWLSAALANVETCMDGFEGTNGIVKRIISTGLDQVISMVKHLLTQVHPVSDESNFSTSKGQFPSWVKTGDKKVLQKNGVPVNVDAVVATDGTGNYTKLMDAVLAAPNYSMKRHVIYIKRGVYTENVEIKKNKWNLMMVGDGMNATVISGNQNTDDCHCNTYKTATFVNGKGFIAKEVSFQNTAGPEKRQAVALRSDSDLSVFYRCGIFGYQDTLYPHSLRQFYRECKITGTVDFIFGHATAVFQNCQIMAKKGLPRQKNTITANGRTDPDEASGFSIQNCSITADSDLLPFVNSTPTYLGRPWKNYSRTIFMESYMSDVLWPEGWLEYNGSFALDTLYYAEYKNYGPGAELSKRVKWPGHHVFNDSSQASKFTVAQLILGDLWLPSTGVAFTSGLVLGV